MIDVTFLSNSSSRSRHSVKARNQLSLHFLALWGQYLVDARHKFLGRLYSKHLAALLINAGKNWPRLLVFAS
jgi:hypothetical protein